jgi:uncharacterized membrane protein
MEARAKLLGHPIHQMLIVFPLGLLATSFVFDIIHLATGEGRFAEAAYWMVTAGVIGALLAAPFGLIDWLAIPRRTRARQVGALHGIGNVIVLVLFVISWIARYPDPQNPGLTGFFLSLFGVLLAGVTGWLGGELVNRYGIGVSDHAGVNAPSTLGGKMDGISMTRDMRDQEERTGRPAA